jgi:hypothetical protein
MTTEELRDTSIWAEAMERVKKRYATEVAGDACFIRSKALLSMFETIKNERETKRKLPPGGKQQQEQPKPEPEKPDTNPPPEAPTDSSGILVPSRVPTREELYRMIEAQTKNYRFLFEQLNGLNCALDEMQAQMKVIADRLKALDTKGT